MTDAKLLPCPFCGATPVCQMSGYANECVRCDDCSAWGPAMPTISGAIIAWNRRIETKSPSTTPSAPHA
jgi:Lar family restriction alleviation protein